MIMTLIVITTLIIIMILKVTNSKFYIKAEVNISIFVCFFLSNAVILILVRFGISLFQNLIGLSLNIYITK